MSNKQHLVIIGAGGHGRVAADCAEQMGNYPKITFLDDCYSTRKSNAHWPITGPAHCWQDYRQSADFFVAFGDNAQRAAMLTQLTAANCQLATLIHPSAVISKHCTIAPAVLVAANAVINIGSRIELGCIINTAATVDHDCHIQAYCHLSPGVNIAGGVKIGQYSWLGIASAVIQAIEIAKNTQCGAGAVITKPTKSNQLYVGVPATPVRTLNTIR
ncbi:sugar O-acyltransferase, sialic acid O-acetyltransferase NeuD family [Colwellia chukchiensis]|uniref:Sugar O-acyltransferase, sialic acid O-acetyltransferase NeuD family n=1 Tax=Colwellia chukchiensis TaxID=641665 RepID=A0A1H7PVW9_9GAMM|nr:acetyltransferase [Colwellia chukchiensis]SEL39405.1 sugar O-acyltransferase, sialic acid O-acetyltransferase NeuD family [Colwellia chukchiensis]